MTSPRLCETCHLPLKRRDNEPWQKWLARRCCSRPCADELKRHTAQGIARANELLPPWPQITGRDNNDFHGRNIVTGDGGRLNITRPDRATYGGVSGGWAVGRAE